MGRVNVCSPVPTPLVSVAWARIVMASAAPAVDLTTPTSVMAAPVVVFSAAVAAPVMVAFNSVMPESSAALSRTETVEPVATGPVNGLSRVSVMTGGVFGNTLTESSASGPSLPKRSLAMPRNTMVPACGSVNGTSNRSTAALPTVTAFALSRKLTPLSAVASTASSVMLAPAVGVRPFFIRSWLMTGPSVSSVANIDVSGCASAALPAKSRTPLTLAVRIALTGSSTVGTKVSTRLFTPNVVVPGIGPAGPVRVKTAPGWMGSSKLSRSGVRGSTCTAPPPGVKLSTCGGRWSRVVKVALNNDSNDRPTRSFGPRLVMTFTALRSSPSTTTI